MMTNKSPDPTLTATEVNERAVEIDAHAVLQAGDEVSEALADAVAGITIKWSGDEISADQLEQLLAIRDGEELNGY